VSELVNKIDPITGQSALQLFAAGRPTVGRFPPSVLKWKLLAWLEKKLKDTFSGVPQFKGLSPSLEAFFFTLLLGYTIRVGNSNTRERAMHRRIMDVLVAFRAGSKRIVALDQDPATDQLGEEEVFVPEEEAVAEESEEDRQELAVEEGDAMDGEADDGEAEDEEEAVEEAVPTPYDAEAPVNTQKRVATDGTGSLPRKKKT
jgi:hypothetical protein